MIKLHFSTKGNGQYDRESGLAEVIGFILIICVIFLFMTIWVTYYVPLQGRDAEIEHMNYVKDWFTDYKITLDSLWMNNNIVPPEGNLSGVLVSTSLDLGTLGGNTQSSGLFLPLMRPIGSYGTIRVHQYRNETYGNESLILTFPDNSTKTYPLNVLEYSAGNYYWIPQTYYYQMGGVFLNQTSGTVARIPPTIVVEKDPLRLNLTPINILPAVGTAEFSGSASTRIDTRMMTEITYIDGIYSRVNLTLILRDSNAAKAWEDSLIERRYENNIPVTNYTISRPPIPGNTIHIVVSPNVHLLLVPANFTVAVQPAGIVQS